MYNELSQLTSKLISIDNKMMQNINYSYNERGWLTKINDPSIVSLSTDFLGIEYFYNNVDQDLSNMPSFSGNISGIKWKTVKPTGVSNYPEYIKAYKITYDSLGRYIKSNYFEESNGKLIENHKNVPAREASGKEQLILKMGMISVNSYS